MKMKVNTNQKLIMADNASSIKKMKMNVNTSQKLIIMVNNTLSNQK